MSVVTVHHGDSRDVLKGLADASIDSVVTDPPYALVSIGKRFGADNAAPAKSNGASGVYARASSGFMGQRWDTGETAFSVEFWAEVMRVLKPGGHVVAFSGTRTYHRLACAVEDAGFEIRDMCAWNYGSGFPKSHNIIKKLQESGQACSCHKTIISSHHVCDENLHDLRVGLDASEPLSGGAEPDLQRSLHGRGGEAEGAGEATASAAVHSLRDVRNSSSQAAKPCGESGSDLLQRVVPVKDLRGPTEAHGGQHDGAEGDAAVRREEPGMEGRGDPQAAEGELQGRPVCAGANLGAADGTEGRIHHGASARDGADVRLPVDADGSGQSRGPQPGEQHAGQPDALPDERGSQAWGSWPVCPRCLQPIVPEGYGTALKPALEPIALARKPLERGLTIAANVRKHGTGALNIDASRIGTEAHVIKGGGGGKGTGWGKKNEVNLERVGRFPANVIHDGSEEVVGAFPASKDGVAGKRTGLGSVGPVVGGYDDEWGGYGSEGSAARFFYSAKADAEDRLGSKHPTVKPVDLMAWLCRLVTPPGGTVLDPFAGSGSTGVACITEGFDCILVEREPAYVADIERRIAWAKGEGRLTSQEMARDMCPAAAAGNDLPLFSGDAA